MATKRKGTGTYATFYGADRILKQLERMGKDINGVMESAISRGSMPIKQDLIKFMQQHVKTGATLGAFHDGKFKWRGDTDMSYGFGWLTNDPGLPALFLEIGTPTQKPYFFAYYAKRNNIDKFDKITMDYLERYLTGVWG